MRRPSAARTGMRPAKASWLAGVPNQIVALVPSGKGEAIASRAVDAVNRQWEGWLDIIGMRHAIGRTLPRACQASSGYASPPARPVRIVTCVDQGQEALRRGGESATSSRSADYAGATPCVLSPHWPAERTRPKQAANHDRDPLRRHQLGPALLAGPGARGGSPKRQHTRSGTGRLPIHGLFASAPYIQTPTRPPRAGTRRVTG